MGCAPGGGRGRRERVEAVVYRIVGVVFILGVAAFAALIGVSLGLLAIYRRTGRVSWPRLSAVAASLLYSPLCTLLRLFGKPTRVLDLFVIEAANAVMADAFRRAGPVRVLVGPQCLRAGECKAPLHPEEGYQCLRCGRCMFAELAQVASESGFRLFIVPGDRFARRIGKRLKVDAAVAMACPTDLSQALVVGMRMGVATVGVPLQRDGCFETDVDVELVKEAMRRCGVSSS